MVPAATYIFGMHDSGAEQLFLNASRPGWVVVTVQVNPVDTDGDLSTIAGAGMTAIVRLNNGYDSQGTLPVSTEYDTFALQCASFVSSSTGAHIWIIGNEPNLAAERPGNASGTGGEVITPALYAQCYNKCRTAIKSLSGHANDWVIPAPVAPWNVQTSYSGNATGDWIQYFKDMLNACIALGAVPDAVALHTYTHGFDVGLVNGEKKMDAPFGKYRSEFRTYRDFIGAIPAALLRVPILITETQPVDPDWWQNSNIGWIQAVYAEINTWNATTSNQPVQALCVFRWLPTDTHWSISDKAALRNDFRAALLNNYPVRYMNELAGDAAVKAAGDYRWMPINTEAALYKFAQTAKLGYPQTDEFEFTFDAVTYVGQVFSLGIAYVKKGDWGNAAWTLKPNTDTVSSLRRRARAKAKNA